MSKKEKQDDQKQELESAAKEEAKAPEGEKAATQEQEKATAPAGEKRVRARVRRGGWSWGNRLMTPGSQVTASEAQIADWRAAGVVE